MPTIAIAGVPLPVGINDLSLGSELVGRKSRNQSGWTNLERRREKLVFDFTLVGKSLDEAMMYRALILGEGEHWDTLTSQYGSKGYPLTGTGTRTSAGGGNPINTNGVWRCTAGQTLVVKGAFYDQAGISTANAALFGSTVIGWRRDDAAGTYRAFGFAWRSLEAAPTVKREALGTAGGVGTLGAPQAFTGAETFAVAAKDLTITAPVGGPFSYSNLHVIPWYLKAAQIDLLLTGRNTIYGTLPQLPRVYVQTDFLPLDNVNVGTIDSVLICTGEIESMPVQPAWVGGVFDKTRLVITGRLTEV